MSTQIYHVSKDVEKGPRPPGTVEEAETLTGGPKSELRTTAHVTGATKPAPTTLVGKIRAKKQESSNLAFFCASCCCLICGSVVGLLCIAIAQAIPIAMIVIGSIYVHDCPRERFIPIYLIVGGCAVILASLIKGIRQHAFKKDEAEEDKITKEDAKRSCLESLLMLFCLAWFIAGSVWIYRIHKDFDSDDSESEMYCHPVLYWFAFWMTTIQYIILAICLPFLICFCCGYCCLHICKTSE